MVSAIIPAPKTDAPMPLGFLRLWDGTGVPVSDPLPLDTDECKKLTRNGDPPNRAVQSIEESIRCMKSFNNDFDLEAPISLCGRVANAAIWEREHWHFIRDNISVGMFVRLRNVNYGQLPNAALTMFILHSKSWITHLPMQSYEIKEMLLAHDKRVRRREFNKSSGYLPLADEEFATMNLDPQNLAQQQQQQQQQSERAVEVTAAVGDRDDNNDDKRQTVDDIYNKTLKQCRRDKELRLHCVKFSITKLKTDPPFEDCLGSFVETNGGSRYIFVARLSDTTCDLEVIVPNEVATIIFGMSAASALEIRGVRARKIVSDIERTEKLWLGKIQPLNVNNQRYFTLSSIQAE